MKKTNRVELRRALVLEDGLWYSKNMKKANRLQAIKDVESELRYTFNNRIRIRDREDYDIDIFESERRRIRQLINILRALREND